MTNSRIELDDDFWTRVLRYRDFLRRKEKDGNLRQKEPLDEEFWDTVKRYREFLRTTT